MGWQEYRDRALDELVGAANGKRNIALNAAAYKFGRLVGGEFLTAGEATDILENAATSMGLRRDEARSTIKSGLSSGKSKPYQDRGGPTTTKALRPRPHLSLVVRDEAPPLTKEDESKIRRAATTHDVVAVDVDGTPGEVYLRRRGVVGDLPPGLKFVASACALSVPLWTPTGDVVARHSVFLTKAGEKNTAAPRVKQTNGKMLNSAFRIEARQPGAPFLVVDGPEDALVAAEATGWHVLAMCGKSRFKHAADHVPVGSSVLLIADNDNTDLREYGPALAAMRKAGAKAKVIACEEIDAKDICDAMEKHGQQHILDWLHAKMTEGFKEVVEVRAGELDRIVDESIIALARSGLPIYQRSLSQLVFPAAQTYTDIRGRSYVTTALMPINREAMHDFLVRAIDFQKYAGKEIGLISVDVPAGVAATILARAGQWPFPQIIGVATAPTMRFDGSVLIEAGFDPATKLFMVPDPLISTRELIESPTLEDATNALFVLLDLLREFPFVGPVDRAVALSGILSAVVRPAMTVVPLHALRAATPGTGKSFLVDLAAAIATGQPADAITPGKTKEEMEKRLGGLLLAGSRVISLDNVNDDLGGDLLCQAVERPRVDVRRLGTSEITTIESASCIFANGNGLRIEGDMVRRAVIADLDAGVERPELRQFSGNPVERVLADRGRYVAACLNIVRAYRLAGMPGKLPVVASFQEWSDFVRSALVWVGEADPADSMNKIRQEDPYTNEAAEIIAGISRVFGASGKIISFTSRELAQEASNDNELSEVLVEIAGDTKSGGISTKKLGKWLTRHAGRFFRGARLVAIPDQNGNGTRFKLDCK